MKLKSLKLFVPPIFWDFIRKLYFKINQSKEKIDTRRWWNSDKVISDNYKFKKILKNFDKIVYAVTLKKETRDCLQILPKKNEIIELDNSEKVCNFLFGIGNNSYGEYIEGSYEIKLDNEKIIKSTYPSCGQWENFKILLNSNKKIEIINNTDEILYFSCPSILEEGNKEDINNCIIIFLDQIDADIFQKMNDENLLPFISNFFKNSINLSNFYSSSEWTMPSLYSFFTGQFSSEHGFFDFSFTKNISDPMKHENLISFYKNKNFFNLGVSRSKGHHPGFNFHKYFDRFFYFPSKKDRFREEDFEQLAIEHLASNSEGKNFIFLHYLSTHAPYYGNTINEDINLSSQRIGYPLKDYENAIIDIGTSKIEKVIDKTKIKFINKRREERLKSLDLSLSKLFNFIEKKIKENTIVLLTSDHGINHVEDKKDNFLNKDRIHVPLKIFHPSIKNKLNIEEFYSSVNAIDLIKNLNQKFFTENDLKEKILKNKNKEVISESIFGNIYKITIISKEIIFHHICYFNEINKTIYLNKLSRSKIDLKDKDKNLDESLIKIKYLEKIRQHLNQKSILKVEN